MITNQTDAVAGYQHVRIGGCKCYQLEKKESIISRVLLDSKSTTDIFGYSEYLANMKTVPTKLNHMANVGLFKTNQ